MLPSTGPTISQEVLYAFLMAGKKVGQVIVPQVSFESVADSQF